MKALQFPALRLYLTLLATFAILAVLAWEHFNGGVTSHHILHRADMPAISNWWGALLLPALTWFLAGRVQKRAARNASGNNASHKIPGSVISGFFAAVFLGTLLSVFFTHGNETLTAYVFQTILLLALLLPAYRAECLLGFVLGMTLTFGVVIPTTIACIIAALSAFVHLLVVPALVRLWRWLKGK